MLSLFWGQEPAWPGLASLALLPKRETKAAESFPPASAGDPHGLILCVKTQRIAGIAQRLRWRHAPHVDTRTPLHTREHGLPWHAGAHGPQPTPAAPCRSWPPHKPCVSTRCLLKRKDRPPLGRPALPRHKGAAFSSHPKGWVIQGLLWWWRTGEWPQSLEAKVRDPRIQPPPTDGTRHPPHWPPRHLPRHSGAQESQGIFWIKIQPLPLWLGQPARGTGHGVLHFRQVWGAVCQRRVEPLSSLGGGVAWSACHH